jgi:cardiolipin synthase
MMYWLIAIFHLIIMPLAAVHALICKRDHRAALGWIGVIVLFPLAGPLLYLFFGINRLRTRARVFTGHHLPVMHLGYERATRDTEPYQDPLVNQLPLVDLAMVGGRATGIRLTAGNAVEPLFNGEGFYPELVRTVDRAQRYALISSYIFSARGVAGDVIKALARAADRGVEVKVLIDGMGAWYSMREAVRPLQKAGVEMKLFRPPSLFPPSLDFNLRNHRKIAVVDGHTGFFGGINIDARHMVEDPDNKNVTADVHFKARGPVVSALHRLFADDWHLVTKQHLDPPPEVPQSAGKALCRVIDSGPGDKLNQLTMTMIGIFAAARESITIMVPYFLPNHDMVAALQAAVLRGVRVRVVLPERSNLRYVDWATRNMLWELLLWDVEIYYKSAPFDHAKLYIIDSCYVMAGSANLDARSLRLNFELGVEIFDSETAQAMQQHTQQAIAQGRRVELSEVDARPLWQRVRDAFFWLFSSYL